MAIKFLNDIEASGEVQGTSLDISGDASILSGAGSGSLTVGRNSNENIVIDVGDQVNSITAYQDSDSNSTHNFILNRTFLGSGANNFIIQKGGTSQLTLDTSANATFAGTIGSGAITSTGKIQGTELEGTSLDINGLANITAAAGTSHLLTLHNTSNASGASINFSDVTNATQTGTIGFLHSDSVSQGGGSSFHVTSTEADMVLVVGGRVAATAHGSNSEVDYGFVGDIDTGMMRSGANALRFVAGGTTVADIGAGQFTVTGEVQATSLDINGAADISGNATLGGIVLDGNTVTGIDDSSEFTDDDAHIMTSAAINDKFAPYNWVNSRGENLFSNGSGLLGDITNMPGFTFDGSNANNSPGSFKWTGTGTASTSEFMPVDASRKYKMQYDAKTENGVGKYYGMTTCFDVDGNGISASHHMYRANTLTTLAVELVNGATTMTLTDSANWNNSGTAGSSNHLRSLIRWDYTNSFGYTYPEETYSRNYLSQAWDPGDINFTTHVITLRVAWAGGTIAAGTKVSNGSSGGSYKYNVMSNQLLTTDWVRKTGYMDGVDYSGTNNSSKFPPGTAKIKLGWLMNYQNLQPGEVAWFTNINVGVSAHEDDEIADAVERATDSNTFKDADHTKLNAIEASADVTDATNVTAAGALMKTGGTMSGAIAMGSQNITGANNITAASLRCSNIVTNKVVKFDGTQLNDANITDTGSLITLGSNTVVSGELEATTLDINGAADISGTLTVASKIEHTGDSNTYFGFDLGNDTFRVVAGGAEKLRTASAGIEINGELQADTLDIDGNADISGTLNQQNHIYLGSTKYLYLDGGGNTSIRESSADTVQIKTNGTPRMTLDNSKVLFAGEIEGASLDINGTANISGLVTGQVGFGVNYAVGSTVPMVILANAPTYGIFYRESSPDFIEFKHNNVVKQSFDGSGNATFAGEIEATSLDINGNADISGNLVIGGTVDGIDISTDVSANTDKISYNSAASTKLGTIETSATADQTNAEIRTAVEAATDSNVFTDADHTKLGGVATSANNYSHPTGAGNKHIPTGGTVGQILKNTASGTATWQTDANTTYTVGDGGLTTNDFTNADHSKLNAIEASADVTDATNVTAAGALMDSEVTNLTQVKAFNSSDYATAAQGTLATNAMPKGGGAFSGAVTTNNTIDGRQVGADGDKLDTIAENATVDQTVTNSTSTTSSTTVASATAVKAAYDRGTTGITDAADAQTTADDALPTAGGTMSGAIAMGGNNITGGGTITGTTLTGTSLDMNGNANLTGRLTVGVNDAGHDVILYGNTANKKVMWDTSVDHLKLYDNTKIVFGTGGAEADYDGSIYWNQTDLVIDSESDLQILSDAIVTGDVTATGAVTAKTYDYISCGYYDNIGTSIHYLPLNGKPSEQGSEGNAYTDWVAPCHTTVKSIQIRFTSIIGNGDLTMTVWKDPIGSGTKTSVESETVSVTGSDDNDLVHFLFDGAVIEKGETMKISIQATGGMSGANTFVTVVLLQDWNDRYTAASRVYSS